MKGPFATFLFASGFPGCAFLRDGHILYRAVLFKHVQKSYLFHLRRCSSARRLLCVFPLVYFRVEIPWAKTGFKNKKVESSDFSYIWEVFQNCFSPGHVWVWRLGGVWPRAVSPGEFIWPAILLVGVPFHFPVFSLSWEFAKGIPPFLFFSFFSCGDMFLE